MKCTIELGCLSPTLSEQLKGVLPAEKLVIFDKLTDAINRLSVFGLLSDSESDRARKRLIKMIQRKANEIRGDQKA